MSWDANALIGQQLGQFQIKDELGRGGMAVVYKGYQPSLDRWVAIKTLPTESAGNRDMVSRFHREAEAMVALNHTNIVQIIDKGEEGGLYYFAMEFVDGPSLQDLLKQEQMSMDLLFDVACQVCDGLEYAHRKGIVHRDMNPGNVLYEQATGLAKIADFGIARLTKKPEEMITLTATNVGMGTMNYMAPEQKTDAASVDHRADIYSVGVMIYEMFTGKLPMGRFKMPTQLNPQLPRKLDEIVTKCLDANPEDRYDDIGQLKADLEQARQSSGGGTLMRSVRDAAERTLTAMGGGSGGGKVVLFGCFVLLVGALVGGAYGVKVMIDGQKPDPDVATSTEDPKTEGPKTEGPKTEAPKTEASPKTEAPKTEDPKTEDPKTEDPKTEAPKTEDPKTEDPGPTPKESPSGLAPEVRKAIAERRAELERTMGDVQALASRWGFSGTVAGALADARSARGRADRSPSGDSAETLSDAATRLRDRAANALGDQLEVLLTKVSQERHAEAARWLEEAARQTELKKLARLAPAARLKLTEQRLQELAKDRLEASKAAVEAGLCMARLRVPSSQLGEVTQRLAKAEGLEGSELARGDAYQAVIEALLRAEPRAPTSVTPVKTMVSIKNSMPGVTHLQALTGLGKGRFAALGREGNAAIQLVVFRVVGEELQLEGMTRVKPGTVALACGGLVEDSQDVVLYLGEDGGKVRRFRLSAGTPKLKAIGGAVSLGSRDPLYDLEVGPLGVVHALAGSSVRRLSPAWVRLPEIELGSELGRDPLMRRLAVSLSGTILVSTLEGPSFRWNAEANSTPNGTTSPFSFRLVRYVPGVGTGPVRTTGRNPSALCAWGDSIYASDYGHSRPLTTGVNKLVAKPEIYRVGLRGPDFLTSQVEARQGPHLALELAISGSEMVALGTPAIPRGEAFREGRNFLFVYTLN